MTPTMFLSLLFFIILSISHPSFQMLLLPLTHTLSQAQFNTTHHLLKSTSARSAARFRRQLSLPLSPGSDYTLSFNLGHQAQPITLYMDTGSDLVWLPCAPFKCILCEGKPNASPPANITRSVAVSCKSLACSAAHNLAPSSDLCAMARCPLESIETSECANFKCPPFYYAYGDGSLVARLYRDSLSLSSLSLRNFTFGCAHTALAEPTGVAGFGRGLLSLPAQLATLSPQLGNRFSYCLVSHSFDSERVQKSSPLILGRYEEKEKEKISGGGMVEFAYTPMLENPKHPYFYLVSLIGISVGKRNIPAPEMLQRVNHRGDGGVVVDSGTTFTMLPEAFYNSVVDEFDRRVGRVNQRARKIEEKTGLAPCYYLNAVAEVPVMTLRFAGGNSSVVLPRKNYFYEFLDGSDETKGKKRVGCLMLMNGGDERELSGGPGATLGNYQQQGFEVVYDLVEKRVGFAKRHCASLWDRLNRDKN
ncbi:probable aspartyl protease At4g16563 [Vigna radiata var. radiata]|uniref:Probable aspartyl protease At4g16563 n=1 Tax=Vigna radiata var. radiata TaxID=3916 RepID=A0A1S3UI77_VIGRR|nr:probable aspartyl protease At4g16563 [Vigna radiata var. radiata]